MDRAMLQTVGEQVKTVDNCFYEAKFPKQGVAEVSYACDRYNYATKREMSSGSKRTTTEI